MREVKRGSSYEFSVGLRNVTDLSGYSCLVQLRNASDDTLIASSSVSPVASAEYGQVFPVRMTDTQSQTLEIGKQYTLAAEISDGTGFSKEECRTIKILKDCVYT